MKSSTVSAYFVTNMLAGVKDRGYDLEKILRDNQIAAELLWNKKARVTFEQLSRLSLAVMELLDDECYGLIERPLRRNTCKLMLYAAINADTVGRALQIMSEFFNILNCGLVSSVERSGTQTRYSFRRLTGHAVKNNYAIEHFFLTIHRTLCWMAKVQIPILQAELDYPKPSYGSEYRQLFQGAPVDFSKQVSSIVISEQSMRLQNLRDTRQLQDYLRLLPLTLLTLTEEPQYLSAQLRSWLERQLSQRQRAPDIDAASARFELHPQAMRRSLKQEGTSYQKIKMETRRDLAIAKIQEAELSIEAISHSLDFSEPSAFIRAFKSWTGVTPLSYRKLSGGREGL